MKVLALVTARGGSKGFPGKNLAPLAGRPLVGWSYETLRRLRQRRPGLRIFLSTDSAEIASAWPGRDRPGRLRPTDLAADHSSSIDVVRYELGAADAEGFRADAVLLLQPTSPLLRPEDLARGLAELEAGAELVVGVTPVDHPIEWCWTLGAQGALEAVWPSPPAGRRQELREAYRPVGFYLARRAAIEAHPSFIVPGVTRSVVVRPATAVDIDRPADLDLAHALLASGPTRSFDLGGRGIGAGHPCFVIAEAGVNHNGDVARAVEMVRAAARAGADAIKFQTFRADELVTAAAPMADYQARNIGRTSNQMEMLASLELPYRDFERLMAVCAQEGIRFLTTVADVTSARQMHSAGLQAFKLGSGELTNLPLLREVSSMGLPVLLSTGMATLDEVAEAVATLERSAPPAFALLHCVSAYPAPCEESNLRAIRTLREVFGVPVGLSDHTLGWEVALAGVALGASIVEKHFTLDRALPGPDHSSSLEPDELRRMIEQLRRVESALGDGVKRPTASEHNTREVARRSLVLRRALPAGATLGLDDVACKRPGTGIAPSDLDAVIGMRLRTARGADELLQWTDLEP